MAENIENYLTNFLTLEEKKPKAASSEPLERRSNPTYKMDDSSFFIRTQQSQNKEILQFATLYWLRLQSIKPHVKEVAEIKWEKDHNLTYV
jgi:DNA polymerase delta subunit 2